MTSSPRFTAALLTAVALALVVLVPASARTEAGAKYGGTLVVGLIAEPDVLDPSLSRSFASIQVYGTFCESLYETDGKSRLVPRLAAALPTVSKDKLTYTIRVRKGVVFNDGTAFDAQAVVTSLQRHMTLPGSSRATAFEDVDRITAAGAYTVVIRLKRPFTPLPRQLVSAGYILSPAQLAKLGDRFGSDPVCVGPFMFDHRLAGDSVTVIKSPHYYNRNAVFLDKIVFKAVPDAAAASAALKAGDLHVLESISTTELPGVRQVSGLRVIQTSGLGYFGIWINVGNKSGVGNPYSNTGTPLASSPKLRKALEEAIDRNALARVVFGGNVQAGCTPVSPANDEWFDKSIKCTPYNPADAKKLVAGSGVSSPTVRLMTTNDTDRVRLAQFIQAQAAAVGINVVLDTVDGPTTLARGTAGTYDAWLNMWTGGVDPDSNIYAFLASSGVRNYSGYSSPRLDLILANGRKAIKANARKTLYRVAQEIIHEDRPIIYLYSPIRFAGVSSNVTGVQLLPSLALRVAFAQLK